MELSELSRAHERLRAHVTLPALSLCGLEITQGTGNEAEMETIIETFAADAGFITRPSAHRWVGGADSASGNVPGQPVLHADLGRRDGAALQIRHLGSYSAYVKVQFLPDGTDYLWDELAFVGSAPAPGIIRHRRYWQPRDGIVEPFLAVMLAGDH